MIEDTRQNVVTMILRARNVRDGAEAREAQRALYVALLRDRATEFRRAGMWLTADAATAEADEHDVAFVGGAGRKPAWRGRKEVRR